MLRIFIGYDGREAVAFHALVASILEHASVPVSIAPLRLSLLGEVFHRPRSPVQSTDFAFSRFLVPHLSDYAGWSLFLDCDIVVLRDLAELWALRDSRYAVQVVKHEYRPREGTKFLGQVQTRYEKKNWSSAILFNNARCRSLTADYVNSASGLELHQFKWLRGDHEIGDLPHRWNHLVDYDPAAPVSELSNLHFTIGGPYFDAYADCSYASLWRAEREAMLAAEQRPIALPKAG